MDAKARSGPFFYSFFYFGPAVLPASLYPPVPSYI